MERLEELKKLLAEDCPGLELRADEPMSRHTTFRLGGPAALMALPKSVSEAKSVLGAAQKAGVEPFFLGNGSNLLVSDSGYPGFVVKLAGEFEEIRPGLSPQNGKHLLRAGGTVLLSKLSNRAQELGLAGLEFAGGIPGSVGGAVTMNAGAYGGEISQSLLQVRAVDRNGEERNFRASECGFGYRKSIFSGGDFLVVEALFQLEPGDPAAIKARMDELTAQRKAKQPLEYPSAGSMFKRPPGHFAAALIDQCGLKGLTVGGAQVSEKHAGFVINRGGAACADVLELVHQVRERVLSQTGVELEMEVKVLK
ncbi:UDP-N-acetylenolpyruvoylglucosamine reductase [Firmicutes bacterium ASF500]|nr:UDP-N-acetylenolpyruvoylglucosamine reductase [Firmicutes bacterium ASF500]